MQCKSVRKYLLIPDTVLGLNKLLEAFFLWVFPICIFLNQCAKNELSKRLYLHTICLSMLKSIKSKCLHCCTETVHFFFFYPTSYHVFLSAGEQCFELIARLPELSYSYSEKKGVKSGTLSVSVCFRIFIFLKLKNSHVYFSKEKNQLM